MKSIVKRLILAGLTALPAACASYSRQYYDSGYGYGYSPGQYDSGYGYSPGQYNSGYGYGVVERNYYNTYSYPAPVYRTEEHHHHHDGRDNRYPGRRYQDDRRYSASPGTPYRKPGSHEHDANDHYNWNAPTANPYHNRKSEWEHQRHDERNEERQRRPDDPSAHGQRLRQQNWDWQEAKRQSSGSGGLSFERAGARGQFEALQTRQNKQDGQQRHRHGRRQMEDQGGQ